MRDPLTTWKDLPVGGSLKVTFSGRATSVHDLSGKWTMTKIEPIPVADLKGGRDVLTIPHNCDLEAVVTRDATAPSRFYLKGYDVRKILWRMQNEERTGQEAVSA